MFAYLLLFLVPHSHIEDCTCLAGCPLCSILLVLHVSCNDDNTLNVTSNHLEVNPFPEDENTASESGEELTKRGEYFGHPVGKRMSFFTLFSFVLSSNIFIKDEQDVSPVLICKIRKGQELKIRCIAKKVLRLFSSPPTNILTITHRVLQKNTQNGLLVPPFPLNTILTINFATQPTGTKQISAPNGP